MTGDEIRIFQAVWPVILRFGGKKNHETIPYECNYYYKRIMCKANEYNEEGQSGS